jgi:uncharacterized protein YbjT (DUF2867 family)
MENSVLVLGAHGNVGAPLVSALLKRGAKVKAASRLGADISTPEGTAQGVVFDYFKPETHTAAFEGVDAAYIMLASGYTGADQLLIPIIELAATKSIKVVLQTAFGVDADDSIPYRKVELALEQSGTRYAIIRPNWFMDNFHTFWKAGIDQGVIGVPAADGKSGLIDARDIADVAAILLTNNQFDNQAYNLTGPEVLSYAEAAAILSAITEKDICYQAMADHDFIEMLKNAGVPADYAEFIDSLFYPVREGWTASTNNTVEEITGKPARSLKDYALHNKSLLTD